MSPSLPTPMLSISYPQRTHRQAYAAVEKYLFRDPWYVEVNMDSGMLVWPTFNSLQAR